MFKAFLVVLLTIVLSSSCFLPYAWLIPEPATVPPPSPTPAVAPFTATFLDLRYDDSDTLTILKENLDNRYGWNIVNISLADFTRADFELIDPTAQGQVLVVVSGTEPLTDEAFSTIQDYVNGGRNLVILGGANSDSPEALLAADGDLNDWLYEDFGLRFNNDVVIDQTQSFQSPLIPVSTDLDRQHFVTTNGIQSGMAALILEMPNTITIAEQSPENVTVTWLAKSTNAAYTKTNIEQVFAGDIDEADDDPRGPFIVAAAAENAATGSRIVLLSSTSLGDDTYASFQNIDNLSVTFNSLVWATRFHDYFYTLNGTPEPTPSH